MVDDDKGQPQLAFSVVVQQDMHLQLWTREGGKIPLDNIIHLSPFGKVESCAELLNVLAYIKSVAGDMKKDSKDLISKCISLLDKVDPEDDDMGKKLTFIREQLQHSTVRDKKQVRYSPQLLTMATIWQMMSPSLYKSILQEGILTLPSVR